MTVRSLQVVLEIKFYIPGQYLDEVCFAPGDIILPLIQAADQAGIILIEKKNIPAIEKRLCIMVVKIKSFFFKAAS